MHQSYRSSCTDARPGNCQRKKAKRHSVKDAIKNYRTYYRRRGLHTDAIVRQKSKRQAVELARLHPPPESIATSTYELRQDSIFGDVQDLPFSTG